MKIHYKKVVKYESADSLFWVLMILCFGFNFFYSIYLVTLAPELNSKIVPMILYIFSPFIIGLLTFVLLKRKVWYERE